MSTDTHTHLKEKTVSGLLWNFSGSFIQQGISFIVGIILARLLMPKEFGLIGMVAVFIAVSNSLVDSGFSQALIQRKNPTQADYDTVFYFNIGVSCLMYGTVFLSAGLAARFFAEPQLVSLLRVLALTIIVDSFNIIHRTILVKKIDFKILTRIQIIASLFSGLIAILLAFKGFGVWSLVFRSVISSFVQSCLYWYYDRWLPTMQFSSRSFGSLFFFGSKLLASGLMDTLYQNIYYVIIGRYFSASELGFYSRADQFKSMVSQNITSTVATVTYPALSSIADQPERLKRGYRRAVRSTMFITFPLLFGLAVVAEPLLMLLIGEKWRQSVPYLQLLCFAAMLYPLHAMNLNILKVKGRSDLFLRLEILKKLMIVPIISVAIHWGITGLISGLILQSVLAYFINSFYASELISYPVKEQLRDIMPGFLIAALMGMIIYVFGLFLSDIHVVKLVLQVFAAIGIYGFFSRVWNREVFGYFTEITGAFVNKIKAVTR